MRRTRVYIAGRMTNGGQANGYDIDAIRHAITINNQLVERGYAPFCPQLSVFAEMLHPVSYEAWLGMDLTWIEVCDVVLRLPGESKGADREVAHATSKGIPVVASVGELLTWFHPTYQAPAYGAEVL